MTWKKSFLILIVTALLLVACGGMATESSSGFAGEPAAAPMEPAGDMDFAEAETMEEAAFDEAGFDDRAAVGEGANLAVDTTVAQSQIPQERLIIRTANIHLVVADTDEALTTISNMAMENGGWVVSSNVFQYSENAKTGDITIRVPSSGFNSALEALRAMAVEVRSENTTGQDVTEEYVDLSSRLQNLETTADRVRSFMEDAADVEEALAVNAELSRLESEIEVIKGRIQFLSQSASFSTITVQLTPDILSQPVEIGGWRPEGIARDAFEALVEALQGVGSFFIWFGILILPLGILVLIPVGLVVRYVRQRRRGRAEATAAPPAE